MDRYLVVTRFDDGSEDAQMMIPYRIIERIDMMDCTDEEIEVYRIKFGEPAEKLEIYGCWHNPKDPLYIMVTDKYGFVEFDGYGTDH